MSLALASCVQPQAQTQPDLSPTQPGVSYFDHLAARAPAIGTEATIALGGRDAHVTATGRGQITVELDGRTIESALPDATGAVTEIAGAPWNGSGITLAVRTDRSELYWGVGTGEMSFGRIAVPDATDVHATSIWNPSGDSIHVLLTDGQGRARHVFVHDCPSPDAPDSMWRIFDLPARD
jgi:hypothetical protein